MKRLIPLSFPVFSLFLLIGYSCGSESEDDAVTVTTSCAITSIENAGQSNERDVSGCWELSSLSTSSGQIKSDCESGELGGTAGTYAESECPSVSSGTNGCEGIATRYGGTATIWYTGAVWSAEGGDAAVASQCSTLNGTTTTK